MKIHIINIRNLCNFTLIATLALTISISVANAATKRSDATRTLDIKSVVSSPDPAILLKDVVINYHILTESEKYFEITDTPLTKDRTITLVQLAYMLQSHPELLDTRLRGPKTVLLKRQSESRYLDKAKKIFIKYVRENPPWDDWETDVLFSSSDEILITRIGPFERIRIFPYDNKAMLGTVEFRTTFYDKYDREIGKATISPVILRKVMVSVAKSNLRRGQIIGQNNIKKVPVWVGGDKKDYVIDDKESLGRELARTLAAGDIIRINDMLQPVYARRGDMVWVQYHSGPLSVSVAVEAQQNGRMGDIIRVKNKSSNKIFNVELTGDKQAVYKSVSI